MFSPFYTNLSLTNLENFEFNPSDIASMVTRGIFDLPSDEEGQELVRLVTIRQQIEFKVAESGGENGVELPDGTIIERSDDLEFDWDSLTLQDIAESLVSGFDSTSSVVDAIQWGLPGIELEFSNPITVKIVVDTALNGKTLNVVRSTSGSGGWTSGGIVAPATCVVSAGVCSFQATKASYYATTQTVAASPTPAPAASTSGGGSGDGLGPANAPSCNDKAAGGAPTLLSATVSGPNQVALTWSKATDPVTHYVITYGLSSGAQQYGNPNVGGKESTSYTVSSLSGGTTYYFRIRAGNGCNGGPYSNELSATPRGGTLSGPAAGFASGVLGAATDKINVGLGEVGQIQGEVTASAQPSETPQPQTNAGQPPPNVRIIVVVALILMVGFGILRLVVK